MRTIKGQNILLEAVDGCTQENETTSCTGLEAAEYIEAIAKENGTPHALVYTVPAFILRTFYANKTFKQAPYNGTDRFLTYTVE